MLPESDEDRFEASYVEFGDPSNYGRNLQQKRKAIKSQSIFTPSALTKLGKRWDNIGQTFKGKVRSDSTEESAEQPMQNMSYKIPSSQDSEQTDYANHSAKRASTCLSRESPVGMDIDLDSRASTQSDEDLIKPATAQSIEDRANMTEVWPSDPVKCRKLDANPDLWVCSREASAGMAKFFKCPLNTIREDTEMDCGQLSVRPPSAPL